VAFWILWGFDAIIAAVAFVFFFLGLGDGSVSSFNMGLWALILTVLGGIMLGSLALKSIGQKFVGILVLLLLAVPGLLGGLFFLILVLSHPRWN
jgi:hypothetical protein